MPERLVLCGGVDASGRRPLHTLRLDVEAPKDDAAKVNLHIEHISKAMVVDVPDRLTDLLEIACYVFCADQFTPRGGSQMQRMGEDWRRNFRFMIPVRDLAFWQRRDVSECLRELLSFLSEDDYSFGFLQGEKRNGLQPYLDLRAEGSPAGFDPDRIVLFSGGLDSLTGAVETLLLHKAEVALVSHRSSTMVQSKQTALVQALRERTRPGQLFEIGVAANKGHEEARDFNQRSRSFLFGTLGFVIARLFGKDELTFFENGIISLNLPVSEHVLGARATRTTHPRVLAGFGHLFSLVAERDFKVANPFFWLTKSQVVRRLADLGCADLITSTFSCTRVRAATRRRNHCGVCSQCVDRRFAILAAHLSEREPPALYAVDLFLGDRKPGPDLTFAESYVLTASKFAAMSEAAFLSRYGQVYRALPHLEGSFDENAARLHQMHARHGNDVARVVAEAIQGNANLQSVLSLPRHCLLSMIQSAAAMQFIDIAEAEPSASTQAAEIKFGGIERPIRFAIDATNHCVLFSGDVVLIGASFRLLCKLAETFDEDRKANLSADAHRYVDAKTLALKLTVTEHTVRQNVARARRSIADQFLKAFDVVLEADDIIQNSLWNGYRLNPYLAPTSPAILTASESTERHNPPGSLSHLPT